jgi:glycosyltransferase involved in cell wall biosynthesis
MKKTQTKIVHLTAVHPRDDSRIFFKECKSLSKNGYSVTLIVADGLGDETLSGISIIDVGLPSGRFDRMLRIGQKILHRALDLDAEIYHAHDPELLTTCLALKKKGKKVIFDAHEDFSKQILTKHYIHPLIRKIVANSIKYLERYVCKRIDGVITATDNIRIKFLPINANSKEVNNYPIIGELSQICPSKKSSSEICYVGSISEARGIREMVVALEIANKGAVLNLVGGFAENRTEKDIKSYSGWTKVRYWGFRGREEIRDIMARSIAGLVTLHPVPNYLESLPIKMFEYMSAGIPVIASDFPIWKNIIESTNCGVCVNPLDPKSIAKAINFLSKNPRKAKKMGLNGERAVVEKYNWNNEEKKLLDFYKNLENL